MAEENFYHNYTKKELYNLWLDALSYDIKDRRLDKIKHALEETVNLGQYSNDSFKDIGFLHCLLFELSVLFTRYIYSRKAR